MQEDDDIPSDKQDGDGRIPLQIIPGDDDILSDEQKGDELVPPQEMSDDDDIPSEKIEGIERISPKYQIPYSQVCLFEENKDILPFNAGIHKV